MRLIEKIGSFFKKKDMKLQILEVQINDLQREVEGLKQSIYFLTTKIDAKADKVDVQLLLDGKAVAKSVVGKTPDGFKMSVNDIKGVKINETK